ncbi:hypothetical protein, partial [Pandoraea sputorum]|uniref:hypothetical protein n=1 Tax=Pandoraea sputorum TaxID=93222 RepID=UPI00355703EF
MKYPETPKQKPLKKTIILASLDQSSDRWIKYPRTIATTHNIEALMDDIEKNTPNTDKPLATT